jgi:hypothetical protein
MAVNAIAITRAKQVASLLIFMAFGALLNERRALHSGRAKPLKPKVARKAKRFRSRAFSAYPNFYIIALEHIPKFILWLGKVTRRSIA